MAEAIHDDHSPLARFLRESDSDDDQDTQDAPRREQQPDSSPSTSRRRPSPPIAAPTPQPAKRSRRQVAAVERVKYAIATSALLSAKLADALQVYPPLDALQARQPAARAGAPSARARSGARRAQSERKGKGKGKGKGRVTAAEWGRGWETRGQGVTERGVLGTAQAALSGLVGALGRLSVRQDGALESVAEEAGGDEGDAQTRETTLATPQDTLLATVEDFVAASQELDLRVAAALTAIKELECIAHGLGLSDPLPPISRIEARGYLSSPKPPSPTSSAMQSTPSRSPRVPSPLGGPSKASSPGGFENETPSPPALRAVSLRRALAAALSSALDALATSIAALNALLPSDSPLLTLTAPSTSMTPTSSQSHAPQASLSELLRHDSLARAERSEVSRWEEGSSAPSTSRPSSVHLPDGVDPFHPTESTFGGIDRRESGTPQRGNAAAATAATAGGKHRLRVSLGPHHGGSPSGPDGAGGAGARRKRPLSMGGLDSAPPPREDDRQGASDETRRVLLVTLQDRFDDAHDARRGVLWRLLEALDHASSDEAWRAAESALAPLGGVLARAAKDVAAAHAREFPDAATGRNLSADADSPAPTTSPQEREKRRRSGFYARPEADDLDADVLVSHAPPTPTPPSARRPAPDANFAPSHSTSASPFAPRRAALHAHVPSLSAPDPAFAAHAQRMTLALRALQAKARVVLADAGPARAGSAAGRERVLAVWESVGEEVRRLEREWREGEMTLRRALGLVVEDVQPEEEEQAEVPRGDATTGEEEPTTDNGDELNATGAVYATLDASTATDDDLISNRQAVLDAALSASLLPPPDSGDGADSPAEEKVFEAVAGTERRAAEGAKLSRDERIRRMKEAREALALGRSSLESPSKGGSGERVGGADTQRNMVGELREVLKELNRDKGRADAPAVATAAADAPPPPERSLPPPAQLATPPPPPSKPLSPPPPVPQVAGPQPPSAQSAYDQPPPPSPTKSASSPTAQRVPPPPSARRPSQPQFVPPPPTPPRLPLPSPPTATPPSAPHPTSGSSVARYASPPPSLPPPVPAVPSTPGKQQVPRYVSPPPSGSSGRARAGASAATQPFASPFASPGATGPSTPGKQPTPRYVAPPPAARPTPPAPLLPQARYGSSVSSLAGSGLGMASPPGPRSPVRASAPRAEEVGAQDGRRTREGSEPLGEQPQRVKRPSVQTV